MVSGARSKSAAKMEGCIYEAYHRSFFELIIPASKDARPRADLTKLAPLATASILDQI